MFAKLKINYLKCSSRTKIKIFANSVCDIIPFCFSAKILAILELSIASI